MTFEEWYDYYIADENKPVYEAAKAAWEFAYQQGRDDEVYDSYEG